MNNLIFGHLAIAGRIFVGLLVFIVGLILAKLTASISSKSGTKRSRFFSQIVCLAIITLVSAIALQQIYAVSNIVNLAADSVDTANCRFMKYSNSTWKISIR